jgi:cobalt-zinc-cadmium efflux system membrane fusion protein
MFVAFRNCCLFLALVALLIHAAACTRKESSHEDHSSAKEHHEDVHEEDHPEGIIEIDPDSGELAGIQVTESWQFSFRDYLETTGVVSVNEAKVAHIRPLSRGIVEKVFVLPGDKVVSGQSLVRYDNIEMSELLMEHQSRNAELRRAVVELEVTRKLWERGQQLLAAQAIAEKDLELRQAEYRSAEETTSILQSEVEKVAAKLRRYGLSEERLEIASDAEPGNSAVSSHLRAPFSGTVIEFDVAEGEVIAPERILMSISDLSTVWVLADIYDRNIGLIEDETELEFLVEAYPGLTFGGRITYLGDSVSPETRTLKLRAELPNPGRKLKLGMYGEVRIPLGTERELNAIPITALQTVGEEEIVFVQISSNRFERRVVTTGPREQDWIGIEEGIAVGEKVVGKGSFALKSELLRERLGGGHAH